MKNFNIVDCIRSSHPRLDHLPAVIENDVPLSYKSLFLCIDEIADLLHTAGVGKGNLVALVLDNSCLYIAVNLSILSLNAVAVPVDPEIPILEQNLIFRRMDIDLIILGTTDPRIGNRTTGHKLNSLPNSLFFLKNRTTGRYSQRMVRHQAAFVRYTSGTTGRHKGVLLSHKTIFERITSANKGLRITREDTIPWLLNMNHHFVVTILLFLKNRARIVLATRSFPAGLVHALGNYPATFLYAAPFHYRIMTRLAGFTKEMTSNIRFAVSTTAKLSGDWALRFQKKFDLYPSQALGIIEVGLPFINLFPDETNVGSVGHVLPDYRFKVIAGSHQSRNSPGDLMVKGPGMVDAYVRPWRNKGDILQKGWFHTGDVARLDRNGMLYLVGRSTSVINFAGTKMFPEEIEAIIDTFSGVKESLVYPLSHPDFGEIPVARIAIEKQKNDMIFIKNLERFCARQLPAEKIPKHFDIVKTIPRTPSGKPIRRFGESFRKVSQTPFDNASDEQE